MQDVDSLVLTKEAVGGLKHRRAASDLSLIKTSGYMWRMDCWLQWGNRRE